MLLLRTDVDRPPDWFVHHDVFVSDSSNEPITNISRVRLDVDTLQRHVHDDVFECNVSDTGMTFTWRHRAHSQSNTVGNMAVLDSDVLTALGYFVPLIGWLWNYGIVKISNLYSFDIDILSPNIDSVCVQREDWNFKCI